MCAINNKQPEARGGFFALSSGSMSIPKLSNDLDYVYQLTNSIHS